MGRRRRLLILRGTRGSVINFYRHFSQFDVHFIAASFKPFSYPMPEKDHFNLINLPFYKPLGFDPARLVNQRGNLSWIFVKSLEKNLANCDLICLSDTYYFSNLQAVSWAKKNKIPVVTIIWCTIPNHITTWFPPYSWITKKVAKATDLFILRNKTALRFTDSLTISRSKIKVIYKGVDLDKFKPGRREKKKETVKILFTGNLSKAKGLDDLLDSFSRLRKKHQNIRLLIAGSGEMQKEIEFLAGRKAIDYRGFIPYDRLPQIYQEADIYCAPSKEKRFFGFKVWEEYFSYALMEAQASGLPIVATKSGGIPEEVGSKNLLITPGNKAELYQALEKLILAPKLRQSLGKENRKRAKRLFDAQIQAKKTEEAMLGVLLT